MGSSRRNLADNVPPQILRWPTDRARKWTCEFLDSAIADENLLAVIAIGSAVRPNVVSADLDLIVISVEATPRPIPHPMEVDLLVYSAAAVAHQVAGGHDLLGWAIKFGKALFQRDHFWDRMTAAWKDRLPLPSATLARERAMNGYQRLAKVLRSGDEDAAHEQAVSYLTHLARAELLERGIYPASRPELPAQLRAGNVSRIADLLGQLLEQGEIDLPGIDRILKRTA